MPPHNKFYVRHSVGIVIPLLNFIFDLVHESQASPIIMSRRPQKDFRACLLCSIVLTLREFVDSGCPNCQDLMSSAHDGTTSNWEGSIALINPNESWVSKWQGLTNYVPGLYAVR
jgi:transcription elongation factor SPT4